MKKTTTKTEITVVQFRLELGGVLAIFPLEPATPNGYRLDNVQCYSHVGQHSSANAEYFKSLAFASPEQYKDLKQELESIGYKLHVVQPVKSGDSITIIGRRWFDSKNGNTYHSCECLVNGKHVATVDFAYGYERQYEYSGMNRLNELGYLPDLTPQTVIWRYCEDRGIAYHATHTDVNRKKDL